MGGILLAIITAQVFACGSAFQSRRHHIPRNVHGDGVRRCDGRQHPSPRSPLFLAPTDAAAVAYNRDYLGQTLGVSKEKVEKLSSRNGWNVLTLEIDVPEKRVHWGSKRMHLKESEMQSEVQNQPNLLQHNSGNSLAPKL